MDTRRKACYLLIMLVIDIFVVASHQQTPPRRFLGARPSADQSATENSSPAADVASETAVAEISQYVLDNSVNASEAYDIVNEIERIVAESLLTNRTFFYELLQTALEDGGVVSLQTESSATCSELKDDIFAALDSDVPVGSELSAISLLLIFVSKYCSSESLEVFSKLESAFDGPEGLLDLILEYVDGVQEAENEPQGSSIAQHSSPGLEGMPGVPGIARAASAPQVSSSHDQGYAIVQMLSSEARALQPFVRATTSQTKIHLPSTISGDRTKRSTEEEDYRMVLYEHVNYRGRQKTFVPDENLVEFVGRDINDKTSSLYCAPTPCTVIAFQHRDFNGFQIAFENRTSSVGSHYNDHISSLVLLPFSLSKLCFKVTFVGLIRFGVSAGQTQTVCGDSLFTSLALRKIQSFELLCTDCSVILYKDEFCGAFKSFSSDVGKLDDEWAYARSVQIRPWVYEQYEGELRWPPLFYQHANFRGKSDEWQGKVDWVGALNDQYSSFKCFGPCSVLLFEHRDVEGRAALYSGSQSRLPNFNDITSSLLVLPYEVCVTFYEHPSYRGRSLRRCSDMRVMSNTGLEDKVSSLKVECDRCSVIIYEHRNYEGRYKSFKGSVSSVGGRWNDMSSSFQIRPWELNVEGRCQANPREAKAYRIIKWIPILSSLYSLASSIAYAAKGCASVAKERAKDMALDLVLDTAMVAATVLTAGTATAGVYAIKTGIQSGVKAGIKAFAKASVAVAKKQIKTAIKSVTKSSMKKSLKTTVNAIKSIKKLPGQLKKIGHEVAGNVKTITEEGVKKSLQKLKNKVTNSVRTKIDDLYNKADEAIQSTGAGSRKPRCRRALTGCTLSKNDQENYKKIYEQLDNNVRETITKDEFVALRLYVEGSGHYRKIHEALRHGVDLEKYADDIEILQNFLRRADKVKGQDLVRYEHYSKEVADIYSDAAKQGEIDYKSFLSTSRAESLSPDRVPPPKGRKFLKPEKEGASESIQAVENSGAPYIYRVTYSGTNEGVSIQKYLQGSKYEFQDEVLFPPGSEFKIEKIGEWKDITISKKPYKILDVELSGKDL